jgi:carbonic anhydrase
MESRSRPDKMTARLSSSIPQLFEALLSMSSTNPFPTSHWPQQSPIKLFKSASLFVEFPKNYLTLDYRDAPFKGKFVGHAGHKNFELTKPYSGKYPPILMFGCQKAELVKIHLHTPSEHDIEGANQDGEIHLIHKIESPAAGSELIVLGVFFKKSAKPIKGDFFQLWTNELKAAKKLQDGKETQIDPRNLLPLQDKWYRYEGSLTSEPYNEIVTWVVFPAPLGIASEDLNKLKKEAHQPERPTQDINRRFVLRNFD